MAPKQIVIDNQLVSYLTSGPQNPSAKTIIFLHGWQSSAEGWTKIMEELPQISCFGLDLPGFGKSEKPKKDFTVSDYAQIVLAFTEKLDLKDSILVGHSFGGRVAIKLASKNPGSVKKLVLVDSSGFRDDSVLKSLKITLAKLAKPFVSETARKKLSKVFGAADYAASGELRGTFLNVINGDLTDDIKRIAVPTLILWGENDRETPVEFGKKINSLIHDSKFFILPNAGHFSFIDQPNAFLIKLTEFLSS